MTSEKDKPDIDWNERFDREKAQHDAERTARVKAAREQATKQGKEPFSAEELAKYFIPHAFVGAEREEILDALSREEEYYYVNYPEVMTLKEFAERLRKADLYD